MTAQERPTLTVVATSDVHGTILDWDYLRNAPTQDPTGNAYGLARAATLIDGIRRQRGADSVIVVDNGDSLQGTPLAYYYARREPVTVSGRIHPMAAAFTAIGYDALNVGNHEFNYGLDLLATFDRQVRAPVLSANLLDAHTGLPVFQPYTLLTRDLARGAPITVGVLGLTTPGSMVWDHGHLQGRVIIQDMVAAAQHWVPRIRAAGAEVVVVLSHAGIGPSSYDTSGLAPENPTATIAEVVPGIDAIVVGHTHQDVPELILHHHQTGRPVVLTQPRYWASSVSEITLDLAREHGAWQVVGGRARAHYSKDAAPAAAVVEVVQDMHDTAVAYVNQQVATCTEELSAASSPWEDTAILDLVQHVQTVTVEQALAHGPHAGLPVLSTTSPFSRTAVLPRGVVSVRDLADLYPYDNTLQAVVMTGAQVRDYLEYSMRYYRTVRPGDTFDPARDTSDIHRCEPVWDYSHDILAGLEYQVELSRPVGSRIVRLAHPDGRPVSDQERFVVAVNNHRRSGGANYPHVAQADVVYDQNQEIRQLLIDWAQARGTLDPSEFHVKNWELLVGGRPIR